MRKWGKAGQRLTPRPAADTTTRLQYIVNEQRDQRQGREFWASGRLAPHRITYALDAAELFGPEVDRACGVEEPAIDEWELGLRYPTWEQFQALAQLTGKNLTFFALREEEAGYQTSLRFHLPPDEAAALNELICRRFTVEAIASTLRSEGLIAPAWRSPSTESRSATPQGGVVIALHARKGLADAPPGSL